jgi:O-antigen/teichoic acid export membrane protein
MRADGALKLARNLIYLFGAEVFSKLITFAAVAYLARVVGPIGLGYFEFASAVLLCASLIVDQGFGPYGAREIARAPQRTEALVSEIVTVRFTLSIVACGAVGAVALLSGRPATVTHLLMIYSVSLFATPFLLQWVFQGHSLMQTVAILQAIRQAAFAAVVFAFVRVESHIWIVAIAEITGVCAAAVYGVWMYRRQLSGAIRVRLAFSRQLFAEGVPIGLSQMFWTIRMFGATVIVGVIAAPLDVGFFGGAMRILIALHAFIWLYFFNLLPSLSQAWQKGDGTFESLMAQSLHTVAWLAVLGGTVWVLIAQTTMTSVYGEAFAPAGVVLQWLAGVAVAAALSGHYRYGLIAAGHQNIEMVVSALGSLVALVLIPIGYGSLGPSGAAMGLFVAEIVVWWSAWWWAHRRLGLAGHTRILILPIAAAVLAAGLAWFLPLSLSMRLVFAMVAIVALALAFDTTMREHLQRLLTVLPPSRPRTGKEGTSDVVTTNRL